MNRWQGDESTSQRQAADRSQRAARRTVRSLNIPSDSDDDLSFHDPDTSFSSNLNLDGEADMDAAAQRAAAAAEAQRQAELTKPFDKRDLPDDSEAWKKEIKLPFDRNDVKYWFISVESQMKKLGINKQWSKKDSILTQIVKKLARMASMCYLSKCKYFFVSMENT